MGQLGEVSPRQVWSSEQRRENRPKSVIFVDTNHDLGHFHRRYVGILEALFLLSSQVGCSDLTMKQPLA